MPVRHLKKIPADHPIHRGLIIFGRKPQGSSELPSHTPPEVLPPSNEPQDK
jgi:hypothetical protein